MPAGGSQLAAAAMFPVAARQPPGMTVGVSVGGGGVVGVGVSGRVGDGVSVGRGVKLGVPV